MYVSFIVYIVCGHFAVGHSAAEYLGCYQDSNEKRILSGHYSYLTDNTATKCIDICVKNGFKLAGVQAANHCFCGNDVPETTKTSLTYCLMRCPQDKGLFCGGNLTNDVYRTGLTVGPSAASAEYLGCYQDSNENRILSGHYSYLTDNTATKCIDICVKKGFRLAGVQAVYHCFCGNAVPATTKTDLGYCLMRCPQDKNLVCGGNLTNDVYRTGLTAQNLGCYRDSQNQRILPGHYSYLTDNSPLTCIDLCIEKGFELAGVQNTHQCFCGNDVPSTKILDRFCDMPCPQDSKLKCGGNFTNYIYRTGITISTSTSPTTLSPHETVCMGIMDWKYSSVVLINENSCQYRCINKFSKKAITIVKKDGEVCNNGKGICIRDLCHDRSPNSGCPEDFMGARKICKMHCHNPQQYPGISVVMNVKDGDICINEDDYHGTCFSGKCSISLEGQKNSTLKTLPEKH